MIGSPRARLAAVAAAAVGLVLAGLAVFESSPAGQGSRISGIEADQPVVTPTPGDLDDGPLGAGDLPAVAAVATALAVAAVLVALAVSSSTHTGRLVPVRASARAPPRRTLGH